MSQTLIQEIENLNNAVNHFAEKMRQKLKIKARKGYRGWDDKAFEDNIKQQLKNNIEKILNGDYRQTVDIANLAMMLDYIHGE